LNIPNFFDKKILSTDEGGNLAVSFFFPAVAVVSGVLFKMTRYKKKTAG